MANKNKQSNGLLSDITYFLKNVFLLPHMWITKTSVVGKQVYWIVLHALNCVTHIFPLCNFRYGVVTLLEALGSI